MTALMKTLMVYVDVDIDEDIHYVGEGFDEDNDVCFDVRTCSSRCVYR